MNPQKQVDFIKSEINRDTTPSINNLDVTRLTAGQLEFALDLYKQLRTEPGNLFFSPHSLHTAFAMVYAGAMGQTENQIAKVMHYELPQAVLHKTENALDISLNSSGGEKWEFSLHVANSIWGQQDYPFNQDYLDTLAINYGAGLRLADYLSVEGRSKAVEQINSWVKTETQDMITKLVEQHDLTAATRLVLANAIYFNGEWLEKFTRKISDSPFFRLDNSQVNPDWMEECYLDKEYAELENVHAVELDYKGELFTRFLRGTERMLPKYGVELPYMGERIKMLLLVPNAGEFEQFEESLDVDTIQTISNQLSTVNVSVVMPKFAFNTNYRLKDILSRMGMSQAFDPIQADFSGMLDPQIVKKNLSISEVLHVAAVVVDEIGTRAAAAMGSSIMLGGPIYQLTLDRPFIFLIRDIETGAILFLGRVLDPTA